MFPRLHGRTKWTLFVVLWIKLTFICCVLVHLSPLSFVTSLGCAISRLRSAPMHAEPHLFFVTHISESKNRPRVLIRRMKYWFINHPPLYQIQARTIIAKHILQHPISRPAQDIPFHRLSNCQPARSASTPLGPRSRQKWSSTS